MNGEITITIPIDEVNFKLLAEKKFAVGTNRVIDIELKGSFVLTNIDETFEQFSGYTVDCELAAYGKCEMKLDDLANGKV